MLLPIWLTWASVSSFGVCLISRGMKFFLVTGTTKGIGAALRDVLAVDGENVVVTMSRAPDSTGQVMNVFADFFQLQTIDAAFEKVLPRLARQNYEQAVLINNAGIVIPVGRYEDASAAALADNFNVNLVAPMRLTGLFARASRSAAAQRLVINVSSGAAKRPVPGWYAYCSAKAGLEMATRAAAQEAAIDDVSLSICSLAPGVVDTPMQGQIREKSAKEFPDVERFRQMKKDRTLRDAHDVARDIVRHIASGRFANGGLYDLREMK